MLKPDRREHWYTDALASGDGCCSGKRWREEDSEVLGWRHRWHRDIRTTFMTLAIEDGVDPEASRRA